MTMSLPKCDDCPEDRRVETYAAAGRDGEVWITRCIECGQSITSTDAPAAALAAADEPEMAEDAPEVTETDEQPEKPSRGRKAKAETPEA